MWLLYVHYVTLQGKLMFNDIIVVTLYRCGYISLLTGLRNNFFLKLQLLIRFVLCLYEKN